LTSFAHSKQLIEADFMIWDVNLSESANTKHTNVTKFSWLGLPTKWHPDIQNEKKSEFSDNGVLQMRQ